MTTMVTKHYNKTKRWVEKKRFGLLLLATVLVLVLPAFSGPGRIAELVFWTAMTFLFIQSTIVADVRRSRRIWTWLLVVILTLLSFMQPMGVDSIGLEVVQLLMISLFFFLVLRYLFRFIRKCPEVNMNVLITAINIYFIFGIISASLAFLCYKILPDPYSFPAHILEPNFVTFLYYSFITMSTVGYGDITPKTTETQTLAYFIAVTGQLYVAVIIAFLVGKYLVQADKTHREQ
jgi:hypothetical protein